MVCVCFWFCFVLFFCSFHVCLGSLSICLRFLSTLRAGWRCICQKSCLPQKHRTTVTCWILMVYCTLVDATLWSSVADTLNKGATSYQVEVALHTQCFVSKLLGVQGSEPHWSFNPFISCTEGATM